MIKIKDFQGKVDGIANANPMSFRDLLNLRHLVSTDSGNPISILIGRYGVKFIKNTVGSIEAFIYNDFGDGDLLISVGDNGIITYPSLVNTLTDSRIMDIDQNLFEVLRFNNEDATPVPGSGAAATGHILFSMVESSPIDAYGKIYSMSSTKYLGIGTRFIQQLSVGDKIVPKYNLNEVFGVVKSIISEVELDVYSGFYIPRESAQEFRYQEMQILNPSIGNTVTLNGTVYTFA